MLLLTWRRLASSRPLAILAVGIAGALTVAHGLLYNTTADDAFITYRYAENLAAGHGPVFTAGERVEGYSNFLWMVILAGLHAGAGFDIPLTARVLGMVAAVVTVVLTYLLVERITEGDRAAGVLAALLVAGAGTFAAYAPSGLETPLFAALTMATLLLLAQERYGWAGIALGLSVMTRPDGLVVACVVGSWLLVRPGRSPDPGGSRRRRQLLLVALPVACLLLPWTAWRLDYYRHLLPNAMAAKTGLAFTHQLRIGVRYLGQFVAASTLVVPGVILTGLLFTRARGRSGARDLAFPTLLGAVAAADGLFVVVSGGDWMPAWRFFAPIIPVAAALTGICWARVAGPAAAWSPSRRPGAALCCASVGLSFAISFGNGNMIPRVRLWRTEVQTLSITGGWFARTLPKNTLVATYASGALPYRAGWNIDVVDMLGLTDEHIAWDGKRIPDGMVGHAAYDYDYVAGRRPAIVAFSGIGYEPAPSCQTHAAFIRHYTPVVFEDTRWPGSDRWVNLLVRRATAGKIIGDLRRDPRFRLTRCPAGTPAGRSPMPIAAPDHHG
jgi:arabinofuranosyltransferase